ITEPPIVATSPSTVPSTITSPPKDIAPCLTVPVILTDCPTPKTVPSLVPSTTTTLSSLAPCAVAAPNSTNTHTSITTRRFQSSLWRENWEVACERVLTIARGNPLYSVAPE